jgi:hypothetical protein
VALTSVAEARHLSDVKGAVTYVVAPVRNPLDNHNAYVRYVASVNPEFRSTFPHLGLRSFVRAWAAHHEYWFAHDAPLAVFRCALLQHALGTALSTPSSYEDLLEDSRAVLKRVLAATGLWDSMHLTGVGAFLPFGSSHRFSSLCLRRQRQRSTALAGTSGCKAMRERRSALKRAATTSATRGATCVFELCIGW